MNKQGSYPRDISIIAAIFIFLIIFVAMVNLYISSQLRNQLIVYDQNRIIGLARLSASYLKNYPNQAELHLLFRNISNNFDLEHLIISDSLGDRIYDSWMIPLEYEYPTEKMDYSRYINKPLPKPEELIHQGNNFIFHSTTPDFYLYIALNPASSLLFDRIFKWHLFYTTISLFFVGFLGIFLIRNLFLPMRYVAKIAHELGVEMKKEDFVSETFDEMFKKIKSKGDMLVEFSSYIAHEFRNSIGAIIGLARLVEKGKKPAADIIKECRTMEELINRLLEYSRPVKPVLTDIDIGLLIEDALAKTAIPKRIAVEKSMTSKLPQVKGDYDLLNTALANLLKNSVEAIVKNGTIKIAATLEHDFVAISVTDTGVGLDAQDLEKIFNQFYSKKEKGLGLGLAYVKKIMELHHGRAEAISKKGKGSTFTIKLPINLEP